MRFNLQVTPKQLDFLQADESEVLFGGAAGGGKSYAQVVDALLYGARYPGSTQIIMRRTYPELARSIIRQAVQIYPRDFVSYNEQKHVFRLNNGSLIECGYAQYENDVTKFQSAEYDVIRFDELTHFTEWMYVYMLSRLRSGSNNYPKQIKSSTNPGGVGHNWVKERFIDPAPEGRTFKNKKIGGGHTLRYIKSLVTDNWFLIANDPGYVERLNALPEAERKALLEGRWDIFEGTYFDEWKPEMHVIKPFDVPRSWRRYIAIDYGLDMLAGLLGAFDDIGNGYILREVYKPGRMISQAAEDLTALAGGENIFQWIAPADLAGKNAETGKTQIEVFAENGIPFTTIRTSREAGWLNVKEWLRPRETGTGEKRPRLFIFENCRNLIRTLPALQRDEKHVNDVANEPHELTHAPDALRYLLSARPMPTTPEPTERETRIYDEIEDFLGFGT